MFWMLGQSRRIHIQLDKPFSPLFFSWAPYVNAAAGVFTFLKGFLAVYLTQLLFTADWVVFVSVAIGLIAHNWPVYLRFKKQNAFGLLLLGLYVGIEPSSWLMYGVLFFGFSLVFNSILIGYVATILMYFALIWYWVLPAELLLINFLILVVVCFSNLHALFDHFEGRPTSLLAQFNKR